MNKIWLHRISHHSEVSYPLLENGYLTIGFSDFSSLEFIRNTKNNWDIFGDNFLQAWGEIPRTRYNLWRFLHEMKKGDIILVPSWGVFSLYEIVGEEVQPINGVSLTGIKTWDNDNVCIINKLLHTLKSENLIDLGFYHNVKLLESEISRHDYADAPLTARMKIRSTNSEITELESNIENARRAFNSKKPINIHSCILESTSKIVLDIIKDQLNPGKLELLIKWYFENIGATHVHIPAKNESGKEGKRERGRC